MIPGVANTKLSACYATCASHADCAAVVFQNDVSADNTNCWFKTNTPSASTATGINKCAASTSGLSADGTQLVATPSLNLSYLELKPKSVSTIVPSCEDTVDGSGNKYCSEWCNKGLNTNWSCGINTDSNYTCSCAGCNGCPR